MHLFQYEKLKFLFFFNSSHSFQFSLSIKNSRIFVQHTNENKSIFWTDFQSKWLLTEIVTRNVTYQTYTPYNFTYYTYFSILAPISMKIFTDFHQKSSWYFLLLVSLNLILLSFCFSTFFFCFWRLAWKHIYILLILLCYFL